MAASLSSELSGDRRKLLTTDRTGSVSASEGGIEREERERRGLILLMFVLVKATHTYALQLK